MKNKPLRMCLVCRERLDKDDLTRVVKNSSGMIFVDKSKKASGRGTYICDKAECANKLIKTKALNRAFSQEVSKEVYDKLLEELNHNY